MFKLNFISPKKWFINDVAYDTSDASDFFYG